MKNPNAPLLWGIFLCLLVIALVHVWPIAADWACRLTADSYVATNHYTGQKVCHYRAGLPGETGPMFTALLVAIGAVALLWVVLAAIATADWVRPPPDKRGQP
jgi:hypothetical protein